jgi:hypothetical protein
VNAKHRRGTHRTNAAAAETPMSGPPVDDACGMAAAHDRLHDALDTLVACYLGRHGRLGSELRGLSNTTVLELVEWSFKQTTKGRGL